MTSIFFKILNCASKSGQNYHVDIKVSITVSNDEINECVTVRHLHQFGYQSTMIPIIDLRQWYEKWTLEKLPHDEIAQEWSKHLSEVLYETFEFVSN